MLTKRNKKKLKLLIKKRNAVTRQVMALYKRGYILSEKIRLIKDKENRKLTEWETLP